MDLCHELGRSYDKKMLRSMWLWFLRSLPVTGVKFGYMKVSVCSTGALLLVLGKANLCELLLLCFITEPNS